MNPMAPEDPLVQLCTGCTVALDVSDYEPLQEIICPQCGTSCRVQRVYNQFAILEVLGEGGMGTVYKALDTSLNRYVAFKLLLREFCSDRRSLAKLEKEAKITASINHPNVVQVYSFGQDRGQFYMVMELIERGTLDNLMELQGRIAESQVLEVGIQVAHGLLAAHELGLIHRDIKPGNILFSDPHIAKISDFGLAALTDQSSDGSEIWGTPYYIAPEKLSKMPEDHRSDIYSLGATLFHALAGRPPYDAESSSTLALKHLKARAVSLQAFAPDVSDGTAFVINRMMNKDPEKRYQIYEELIEHMKYALDAHQAALELGSEARKERTIVETDEQQTFWGWATAAMLLIALVVAVGIFTFRDSIFKKPNSAAKEKTSVEAVVDAASAAIASGNPDSLDDRLKNAIRDSNNPKTTAILRYLYATALLVNGRDYEQPFLVLAEAGPYSTQSGEVKLARTMVDIGRRLSDRNAMVPVGEVDNLSANGPESIALLSYGLKNWRLGDAQNSIPFFERFLAGNPGDAEWIQTLRPVAEACLADAKLVAAARIDLNGASPEKKQTILKQLDALKAKPNSPGDLAELTVSAINELRSNLGAASPPPAAPPTPKPAAPQATPARTANTVFTVPGTIRLAEFNAGENVGFFDASLGNEGRAPGFSGNVDVALDGNNPIISHTEAGDWLKYDINVTSAGAYTMELKLASDGAGGTLHVEIDGANVTGTLTVPNTGGWTNWASIAVSDILLTPGQKVLKVCFDQPRPNGKHIGNAWSVALRLQTGGTITSTKPPETPAPAAPTGETEEEPDPVAAGPNGEMPVPQSILHLIFGDGMYTMADECYGKPGDQETFVFGVNFGSDTAVTIEGNKWRSHSEAVANGFYVGDAETWNKVAGARPIVDQDRLDMANSGLFRRAFQAGEGIHLKQPIPNGLYNIYFWIPEYRREQGKAPANSVELRLQSKVAATRVPFFQWWFKTVNQKLGPYQVTVQDGNLAIDLVTLTPGLISINGMAIYSVTRQTLTPQEPGPNSLLAHWKFDEQTGTTATDSGPNAQTGTFVKAPTRVGGPVGGAVHLDGSNGFVTADEKFFNGLKDQLTIAVWMRRTTQTDFGSLVSRKRTDRRTNLFFLMDGNANAFFARTTWAEYKTIAPATRLNEWTHLAAVMDGKRMLLYQNAVKLGDVPTQEAIRYEVSPLSVGAWHYGKAGMREFFNGDLDDLRIYTKALTDAEIVGLISKRTVK